MGSYANEHALIVYNDLPSKCWKIRCIRMANNKKLRRINEESQRICNKIHHLGYEDLNLPVRKQGC